MENSNDAQKVEAQYLFAKIFFMYEKWAIDWVNFKMLLRAFASNAVWGIYCKG